MRIKVTPSEFDGEFIKIAPVADRARDLALQKVERIKRFRGAGAVRDLARIRARDGVDAAAVTASASNMLREARTLTRLRDELKGLRLTRRVTSQTIVFGTVAAESGEPAAGFRLQLATDTGNVVGQAVTDDAGLFKVERSHDYARLVEGAKALKISVYDHAGKQLHTKEIPVRSKGAFAVTIHLSKRRPGKGEPRWTSPAGSAEIKGIKGLGPSRVKRLAKAGIKTLGDLARAEANDVARVLQISKASAEGFVEHARQLVR